MFVTEPIGDAFNLTVASEGIIVGFPAYLAIGKKYISLKSVKAAEPGPSSHTGVTVISYLMFSDPAVAVAPI